MSRQVALGSHGDHSTQPTFYESVHTNEILVLLVHLLVQQTPPPNLYVGSERDLAFIELTMD